MLARQGPAERDHCPLRGHLSCQTGDRRCVDARQICRPFCCLGNAVILAVEIGAKPVVAGAMACQKRIVRKSLGAKRMAKRQQHRGITVRPDRNPVRVTRRFHIKTARRDIDKFHTGICCGAISRALDMPAGATITHLPVGKDKSAEPDEKLAIPGNAFPAGMLGQHAAECAQYVRNDDLGSGIAVGVFRACVPADTVQKPMNLALCMMEPAGAGPAV